jgi:hypothetical protein
MEIESFVQSNNTAMEIETPIKYKEFVLFDIPNMPTIHMKLIELFSCELRDEIIHKINDEADGDFAKDEPLVLDFTHGKSAFNKEDLSITFLLSQPQMNEMPVLMNLMIKKKPKTYLFVLVFEDVIQLINKRITKTHKLFDRMQSIFNSTVEIKCKERIYEKTQCLICLEEDQECIRTCDKCASYICTSCCCHPNSDKIKIARCIICQRGSASE